MNMVILTGAGISEPAGIPTFEKLYDKTLSNSDYSVQEKIDSLNEAASDLGDQLKASMPLPTLLHRQIADLQSQHTVTVFTTNVDTLHEQAGTEAVHIHGTLEDPVYFGGNPRHLDLFGQALSKADLLIVIGTRLLYPYLSIPVSETCMRVPSLFLDINLEQPHADMFTLCAVPWPNIPIIKTFIKDHAKKS